MLEKTTDVGEDLHLAKDEIITSMMNRRHLYEDKLSIDEAVKTTVSEAEAKGDLVFQVLNWYGTDLDDDVIGEEEEDDDEGGGGDPKKKSAYAIKMFGVTRRGESTSVTVRGCLPRFYVKIPESFRNSPKLMHKGLPDALRRLAETEYWCCRDRKKGAVLDVQLVWRKSFWGFTNGALEPFLCVLFKRHVAMKSMARYLSENEVDVPSRGKVKLSLFESNIDPLLRFIHTQDLQAAGWVRVPAKALRAQRQSNRCDLLRVTDHIQTDVSVTCKDVFPVKDCDDIAPLLVAAFDIESNSSHGDFSVAVKKYKRVAGDLVRFYDEIIEKRGLNEYVSKGLLERCVKYATWTAPLPTQQDRSIEKEDEYDQLIRDMISRVIFKKNKRNMHVASRIKGETVSSLVDDAYSILCGRHADVKKTSRISVISEIFSSNNFPELEGDEIIQIGTTFHIYGQPDCCYRHILALGSCERIQDEEGSGMTTHTVSCSSEKDLLLNWTRMIREMDPDVVTGFNIFGFDMSYMYDRSKELGPDVEREFLRLGRFENLSGEYRESNLSSSALGDNVLKYVDMQGRTLMDLMKIVQRDHKLDSYKLDNVAYHFTKRKKHDITAQDIFRMQRGTAADRRVVAEYCLQDCVLCNRLVMKLEVIANNLGMANVCSVPLSYIFMRGQGVKVFSLVARQCKLDGFVIPTVTKKNDKEGGGPDNADSNSYEGAIVLEPKAGMYLDDPVTVLDYASLYPSIMISENISHDCLVMDDKKYGNIPGVQYESISYETPAGTCTCKFAQPPEKGVLPRILQQLLRSRKTTRKKIPLSIVTFRDGTKRKGMWDAAERSFTDAESGDVVTSEQAEVVEVHPLYNEFQRAVLDGLQNAYKVTANSLYGQMGAATSPLYLKHVAACTTATGRSLILRAKDFMEANLNVNVIYGDTDSLFMIFDMKDEHGEKLTGKPALIRSIEMAHEASRLYKPHLKAPHDLEYDKTFWPFVIFSKKRYVGNLYEEDVNKCKRKEMGIVLKRRDNAHIVKHVYGGIIDIVLNNCDIPSSVNFLRQNLRDLVDNRTPHDELVITKTLGGSYKDPERIPHYVLAQRIGEREPGNKPQTNDRIPFIYVDVSENDSARGGGKKKALLQGERIEDPVYVLEHGLKPDVSHYITNQIMKPVLQLYSIVLEQIDGYQPRPPGYWQSVKLSMTEKYPDNPKKARDAYDDLREKEVKALLFEPFLVQLEQMKQRKHTRDIASYCRPLPPQRPLDDVNLNKRQGNADADKMTKKKKQSEITPHPPPGLPPPQSSAPSSSFSLREKKPLKQTTLKMGESVSRKKTNASITSTPNAVQQTPDTSRVESVSKETVNQKQPSKIKSAQKFKNELKKNEMEHLVLERARAAYQKQQQHQQNLQSC